MNLVNEQMSQIIARVQSAECSTQGALTQAQVDFCKLVGIDKAVAPEELKSAETEPKLLENIEKHKQAVQVAISEALQHKKTGDTKKALEAMRRKKFHEGELQKYTEALELFRASVQEEEQNNNNL